jgi:hypothetical protein
MQKKDTGPEMQEPEMKLSFNLCYDLGRQDCAIIHSALGTRNCPQSCSTTSLYSFNSILKLTAWIKTLMGDKYEKYSHMRLNPFGISIDLRSNRASSVEWKQRSSYFEPNSNTNTNQ